MTTSPTARQRLAALHRYAAVNREEFTGQNLASTHSHHPGRPGGCGWNP
ncbi:hypothetical protein ACFWWB_15715 [Streptomyces sp. NPDC058690]